jgi:hypothetical protein
VLNLRFGLGAEGESLTLELIGKRIGLTRERVRQIEAQALRKLFCFLTGEESDAPPGKRPSTGPSSRASERAKNAKASKSSRTSKSARAAKRVKKSKAVKSARSSKRVKPVKSSRKRAGESPKQ